MEKRVSFNNRALPYLLLFPQLAVTAVFFFWPAGQALYQSFLRPDPFGLSARFVGLENFRYILTDPLYLQSFATTAIFTSLVTFVAMAVALFLAAMADQVIKGSGVYRTLIVWPYAVAPAVAGVMWMFMLQPSIGVIAFYMKQLGITWNPLLDGQDAMLLVVLASAWKQVSYNFLFFLAGMQAVPRSLIEAAAIDGAGRWRRFWTIIFPLLSPTTFFLLVINIVYAFFETFGVIHTMTSGGPGRATTTLVYKVYADGFVGQDLGSSAAQSVILMVVVSVLTVIQFRYIERRVHY
ncbi:sn-glycerol-3-phosphate ABC transporter permease UgpA [Chelativorans sp. YIM 93263]|uniref:sn-glycerol-3-phosphate ABC transporter permease UgpA n=1 Tax=Chelativorans sp. YIM 93263 TaxID=2906648 RepID=UPI002378E422|nr:sn-glycerol-3-phosphate ABC transporter permease UgpA [Chelativorans sp. YIM 93263]